MALEISDIRIYPLQSDQKLKAYVTIVLNDSFVIREIKIVQGDMGFFVAMPSQKVRGRYQDIVHPLNQEIRRELEKKILEAYVDFIKKQAFKEEKTEKGTQKQKEEQTQKQESVAPAQKASS